jgi:8-oxo-dGTP pyrophosphatase MutT (NUDIX family)
LLNVLSCYPVTKTNMLVEALPAFFVKNAPRGPKPLLCEPIQTWWILHLMQNPGWSPKIVQASQEQSELDRPNACGIEDEFENEDEYDWVAASSRCGLLCKRRFSMSSYTRAGVLEAIRSYCPRSVLATGLKPAAIIVPIQEIAGKHYLTLIERAATLRSHAGEIAFPGGNVTGEDQGALAAALREIREEIGIAPETVEIIGQLDEITVGSRYLVTPFVGMIESPLNANPNNEEVSAVVSVPVSALLDLDCFSAELRTDGRPGVIYHFRYRTFDIWGATARILKQLLEVAYGFRAITGP